MTRLLWSTVLMIVCCGCMTNGSEYTAAAAYHELKSAPFPAKLTVAEVLARSDSGQHNRLRRIIAGLHCARELAALYRAPLQMDHLRQTLLDAEKFRISLNVSLGFLPESRIVYDTAGAFEVPEELPDVTRFEKAAMLHDAGKSDILALSGKIRTLHADAVGTYDAAAHAADPAERIRREYHRLLCCTYLADAVNTPVNSLHEVNAAANRFDAYSKNKFTSR